MPLSDAFPEACCCIFFQKINFYSEHSAVTSDHLLVTYWSFYFKSDHLLVTLLFKETTKLFFNFIYRFVSFSSFFYKIRIYHFIY